MPFQHGTFRDTQTDAVSGDAEIQNKRTAEVVVGGFRFFQKGALCVRRLLDFIIILL